MSSSSEPNESSNADAPAASASMVVGSMAFTACLTIEEFMNENELYGDILRVRCQEVRLPPDVQFYLSTYPDSLNLIVLATPEDPDTVAVVPVLAAIVRGSPRLSMRICSDEDDLTALDGMLEALDLLNELDDFDLPQVFFFDDEWQLVEQWGPRPQEAEAYLDDWLERHPDYETFADAIDDVDLTAYSVLLEQLTHEMRVWYNSGLNAACIAEIHQLLIGIQTDDDENGST